MAVVIAIIARLFGVSPAVANLIAIMVAIAVAISAAWGGYEYIKHIGADQERARIEKDNQDAIDKALAAATDFDACLDAGGVWDFRRQKCGRAEIGAR